MFSLSLCLKATRAELEVKMAALKALIHISTELKGQVSPTNAAHLEHTMEHMQSTWRQLETGTESRQKGRCGLGVV